MNPLFNLLGGMQKMNGLQSAMSQLRADPAGVLDKAGFKIPAGMNDPQQIINHLMQSGQINQSRLAQAQQIAQQYK